MSPTYFAATRLGRVVFVSAEGDATELTGDAADQDRLKDAFERGGLRDVRSLRWRVPADRERSWFAAADWSLSYDPA